METLKLRTKYSQNYIFRKPVFGALILFAFSFAFALLYQPLNIHKSHWFNFVVTITLYAFAASFSAWLTIVLLKLTRFFSDKEDWSLLKEIVSTYLVLQIMGIVIFLTAFLLESPAEGTRWNLLTFVDSCKYSFLIGIIPFAFFTITNYRYQFINIERIAPESKNGEDDNILININSKLKKETLSFHARELLFVTSDGNYVVFYLFRDNGLRKIAIRNSISNIENQLAGTPCFFRCHRAFIVNMDKVFAKKGNSFGYRLSIANCGEIVPVSRKNLKAFDALFVKSN